MKNYNFDEVIDRQHTSSVKWDGMLTIYHFIKIIVLHVFLLKLNDGTKIIVFKKKIS